jgi:hypothetical protein
MEKEAMALKGILDELWRDKAPWVDPLIPQIIEAWKKVIPQSLRSGLYLEGYREGTVYLLVSNPVAGQQFQFFKESCGERINVLLNQPLVKRFRIRAGTPPPDVEAEEAAQVFCPPAPRKLTPKEIKRIGRICSEIRNPEVRRRVQSALLKSCSSQGENFFEAPDCKPRSARKRLKGAGS